MGGLKFATLSGVAVMALALAGCEKPATSAAPKAAAPTSPPQPLRTAPAAMEVSSACDTPTTRFCDSSVEPPPGWTGPLFHLAQDYPKTAPKDAQPWLAFDPKTQPEAYIRSVLAYFYEGNLRADVERSFDPTLNTTRQWYNAPWQDSPKDFNSREPLHGLTRERVSRPGELASTQTSMWNNYAVGFYNAPGGVAIGQVWADHGKPNPSAAGQLPEGTVAGKLLFTTASEAEAPFLAGSPTWNAYVYSDPNGPYPPCKTSSCPVVNRAVLPVRLLQIDIAVKDHRAGPTGWIFGTFVYGGGPGGPKGSGWTNVAPVGVMWGNDPGYSGAGPLKETWINPKVHMPHVGYQGRLNGPVDNPASACISCHMTAEAPSGRSMVPPHGAPAQVAPWFIDLPSGQPFDAGHQSTDDSLQIAVGLEAFRAKDAKALKAMVGAKPVPGAKPGTVQVAQPPPTISPRDGGPVT